MLIFFCTSFQIYYIQNRMSPSAFNWEYFSFTSLSLEDAMVNKLVMLVPVIVLLLSFVWMKLVTGLSAALYQG